MKLLRAAVAGSLLWCGVASAQTNSTSLVPSAATVGTSSAAVSTAHTRRHLELLNQSQTATIYCTIDGSAAVAAATAGQVTLPPLGGQAWSTGVIPANGVNCIATSSGTPLTIIE